MWTMETQRSRGKGAGGVDDGGHLVGSMCIASVIHALKVLTSPQRNISM